jgi:hypothetical protein
MHKIAQLRISHLLLPNAWRLLVSEQGRQRGTDAPFAFAPSKCLEASRFRPRAATRDGHPISHLLLPNAWRLLVSEQGRQRGTDAPFAFAPSKCLEASRFRPRAATRDGHPISHLLLPNAWRLPGSEQGRQRGTDTPSRICSFQMPGGFLFPNKGGNEGRTPHSNGHEK